MFTGVLSASATTEPAININFDPSQMFVYSNVILDCLMPVVYISAGIALGLTIIGALKGAFGGGGGMRF